MSWTLTLKQKDAPGVGAHFIFSFKVQNYAGLIQKVRFHFKKKSYFCQESHCAKRLRGQTKYVRDPSVLQSI